MPKKYKQLLIGLIVSAVFLWLAFRRVPFADLWKALKTINYIYTIPLMFFIMLSMYWRALRWRLYFLPGRDLSSWRLFGPLMVGFGVNNVLPARAGEILRPLALAKQEGIPFSEGIGTIVIERIFDTLTMLVMFFIALQFITFGNISQTWDARTFYSGAVLNSILTLGAAGGCLICLWILWRAKKSGRRQWLVRAAAVLAIVAGVCSILFSLWEPFEPGRNYVWGSEVVINGPLIDSMIKRTSVLILVLVAGVVSLMFQRTRALFAAFVHSVKWIPETIRHKIVHLLESFASGFESLRSPARVAWIVFHSIGIWVAVAATLWVTAFGVSGMKLGMMESMVLVMITAIGASIPSAPGYWGLYEVCGVCGMLVLGITTDLSKALSFILVVHFGQWFPTTLTGLYYAAKIQISPSDSEAAAQRAAEEDKAPLSRTSPAKSSRV